MASFSTFLLITRPPYKPIKLRKINLLKKIIIGIYLFKKPAKAPPTAAATPAIAEPAATPTGPPAAMLPKTAAINGYLAFFVATAFFSCWCPD